MDHFDYQNGEYCAEGVQVARLAEAVGTPFYCYSDATLTRHWRVFSEALAPVNPLICYAVKANGNVGVLATLARLGAGADVVSMGEIMLAEKAGVPPERIVFSGVGKTAEEMVYALEAGIFQFNIESAPELWLLSELAHARGKQARIAVRVNPDVAPGTHAKISTGQKETKFGVPMAEAHALYAEAAGLPGIVVQGVSVHIGSQLTALEPFAEAFSRVRRFVDELRAANHTIRTVDLGGGLGVPYGKEDPPLPAAYAQLVQKSMAGVDAQLIFEPGRLLVANAGILVTRVIYVKQSAGRTFVIVDAGMNDLLRPALYEAHHEIFPINQCDNKQTLVDVVGPVCETGDIFAAARMLPLPKAGDLLAIRTAGAYGAAMASNYNARPFPAEVMVRGGDFAVVRERQTYDEMLRATCLPRW